MRQEMFPNPIADWKNGAGFVQQTPMLIEVEHVGMYACRLDLVA